MPHASPPDASTDRDVSPDLEVRIGRAFLAADDGDYGLIVCAAGGRIEFSNRLAARLLRLGAALREGADLFDLLLAGDEILQLRLRSALAAADSMSFVVRTPGSDDDWLEVRPVSLNPGTALFFTDVTERERSERTLRRKEHRLLAANQSLRLAHKAAHAASWEWKRPRRARWLDLAAAREIAGLPESWTEDEAVPPWRRLISRKDRGALSAGLRRLAETGDAAFEITVEGADGRQHALKIDAAVTEWTPKGRPLRVSGVTVDVTPSKLAEVALREEVAERARAENRQLLLVHELNHRVKNMLATVQSVARNSLKTSAHEARDFEERLMALAWAYEILTREGWEGAGLRELVQRTMAPYAPPGSKRVTVEGPDLWLPPQEALALTMATHELATNAVKYGALSAPGGRVSISWRLAPEERGAGLYLDWVERGGPPVLAPGTRGFGSRLVERNLARELNGKAAIHFEPTGVRCRIEAHLAGATVGGLVAH